MRVNTPVAFKWLHIMLCRVHFLQSSSDVFCLLTRDLLATFLQRSYNICCLELSWNCLLHGRSWNNEDACHVEQQHHASISFGAWIMRPDTVRSAERKSNVIE
jgi:hypothetical protein